MEKNNKLTKKQYETGVTILFFGILFSSLILAVLLTGSSYNASEKSIIGALRNGFVYEKSSPGEDGYYGFTNTAVGIITERDGSKLTNTAVGITTLELPPIQQQDAIEKFQGYYNCDLLREQEVGIGSESLGVKTTISMNIITGNEVDISESKKVYKLVWWIGAIGQDIAKLVEEDFDDVEKVNNFLNIIENYSQCDEIKQDIIKLQAI